ncbi:MAG: UDP-glucose 4-epimerase GalE [Syntrophus sp. (in: bacteria)]|nr:UDP-glucose 4-epimerase GalE [Syntrophus sp. (in: bacteria)]
MKILVTGGAGYIGSHTCVELLNAGYEVVIVDNLCNSKITAVRRIEEITRKCPVFCQADLRDRNALETIFADHRFMAVIHFAGLKAVGESVAIPLEYYRNNLTCTLTLCETMKIHGLKNIVFSSSATVYGDSATVPIREDAPTGPTNPYGRTKWMIEHILSDIHQAEKDWNVILLRYFNPVGAHPSGKIGEDPRGVPNNLAPYITQVAVGKLRELQIFGNDYATPDGTGVRDYIHVVDLAQGHLRALETLPANPGLQVYNLGTGRGYSVLQMAAAFEKAIGKPIPYKIVARRPGDIATSYADPSRANEALGWKAVRGIDEIARDAWNWQRLNPKGYG